MRIFVSGPYSAPDDAGRITNVHRAFDAALAIHKRGHTFFCPHACHFVDERWQNLSVETTWDEWMTWCLEWLQSCDAVLSIGQCRGGDIELKAAREVGIPIYYSTDDIPMALVEEEESATI